MGIKEKRLLLEERLKVAETMRSRIYKELSELVKSCLHENTEEKKDVRLYCSQREYRTFTVTVCSDCGSLLKEVREK